MLSMSIHIERQAPPKPFALSKVILFPYAERQNLQKSGELSTRVSRVSGVTHIVLADSNNCIFRYSYPARTWKISESVVLKNNGDKWCFSMWPMTTQESGMTRGNHVEIKGHLQERREPRLVPPHTYLQHKLMAHLPSPSLQPPQRWCSS